MRLLVYMKDGRTVFLLEKRSRLGALVRREPDHESDSVGAARGIWNPHTGEYVWSHVPVRYIAKNSIAFVEEARGLEDVVSPREEAA
jgi:hypothetical protein